MLAIRWENVDFAGKAAWMGGNVVRTKAAGKTINDGKSVNSQRGVALADWLVDMLKDRRQRVAAIAGVAPESLTGWVFHNSIGGLREASNMRLTGALSGSGITSGSGSPRALSAARSRRC